MIAKRRRDRIRRLGERDAEPGEICRAALPALDPRLRIWLGTAAILLFIALAVWPGGPVRNVALIPLVAAFWPRSRAFVVTDRRLLMYRCSIANVASELMDTWPLGAVSVERWRPRPGWWSLLSLRVPSGVHTGYAVKAYLRDAVGLAGALGSNANTPST